MISVLKKIDQFLLPPQEEMRYAAFVWLVYLSIFFVSLYYYQQGPYGLWIGLGLIPIFLFFYFHAYWSSEDKVIWDILALSIIASVQGYITPGASVFFVFAGAFCCRLSNAKRAVGLLAIITAWIGILSWWLALTPFFYIPAVGFMWMIGGINIYQFEMDKKKKQLKLSQQEIKTLAKTAERERIARDLHDLIGHTFSVITLKAELAGKLIDKDLDKARNEIGELENISRDALKQIREVVTGYRTSDLNTELAHAKYVLESNDIQFDYDFEDFDIPEAINKELAIVLKELVTNILKHAQADRVDAQIYLQNNQAVMKVKDNGLGLPSSDDEKQKQGYGLQGIEERIERLSGRLAVESNNGAGFVLMVPISSQGAD